MYKQLVWIGALTLIALAAVVLGLNRGNDMSEANSMESNDLQTWIKQIDSQQTKSFETATFALG